MDNMTLWPFPLQDLIYQIRLAVKEEMRATGNGQDSEKLISPAEACKLFEPAISKVTLAKWTNEGLIPMQKIGGRVFYKQSDIIEAGTKLKRYKPNKHNSNES